MRFFWSNLIDAAANVFTASSEASDELGGENVANEFRGVPWITGTSTANETLTIDLGSAQAVTAVILLDHTLTSGDSAIAIMANSADSWGAPAFTQALTWANGTIAQTFSSQSYRYWRLKFTKSAAGVAREVGRMFLGTYLEPSGTPDYDGWKDDLVDPSRKTKSVGGQTWVNRRPQFGTVDLDLSRFTQTDADNLKTMFETVGQSKSFFFQGTTASPLDKYWYMKFRRDYGRDIAAFDSGFLWDLRLEMEEQL